MHIEIFVKFSLLFYSNSVTYLPENIEAVILHGQSLIPRLHDALIQMNDIKNFISIWILEVHFFSRKNPDKLHNFHI